MFVGGEESVCVREEMGVTGVVEGQEGTCKCTCIRDS